MAREGHPGNRTTVEIRREIQQRRAEPSRAIALRLGLNPKTVDKWKRRETTASAPMGPRHPVSTTLSAAEEAVVVVFRKHTRLALDDCLERLKPLIRELSRSALHRCLKRYGVSRIPGGCAKRPYGIEDQRDSGCITLRAVALPEAGEEACLLFAISDLTRFVDAKVVNPLSANEAAQFLKELITHAPFRLRQVQTNDHEAFSDTPEKPWDPKDPTRKHPFKRACLANEISHQVIESGDPAPKPVAKGWADALSLKQRWADLLLSTQRWADALPRKRRRPRRASSRWAAP
jgi:hypothetical protein